MNAFFTEEEVEEHRTDSIKEFLKETAGLTEEGLRERYCGVLGYHEVLHTSYIFYENVEQYLFKHPAVLLDKDAHRFACRAWENLCELYQRIGALEPYPDGLETGEKGV